MNRLVLLAIFATFLLGCSQNTVAPTDMTGYFRYIPESGSYYVIRIDSNTSGTIFTYTNAGDLDKSCDDTEDSNAAFTITEGSPWYFSGGGLNNNAVPLGSHTIYINGFDGEPNAYFPASGNTYPPTCL